MRELVDNPVLLRALVLGVFGGVGIALFVVYGRRGPLIFVPYAALLVLLGFLLARDPTLSFAARFEAAFAAYLIATAHGYAAVAVTGRVQRQRLVAEGRLPPAASSSPVPFSRRAWHVSVVLGLGAVAAAAVSYVAG